VLAEPLEHLQSHAVEAVLPIFKAASDEIESTILLMHDADWSQQSSAAVLHTSSYMRRLEAFLKRFRIDYLSHFVPQPTPNMPSFASQLCQRLAARALSFFVRHAALVKPLGESAKLQLAKVCPMPARVRGGHVLIRAPQMRRRPIQWHSALSLTSLVCTTPQQL
jgi:conserved oligomeric Golgi complex subunit 5